MLTPKQRENLALGMQKCSGLLMDHILPGANQTVGFTPKAEKQEFIKQLQTWANPMNIPKSIVQKYNNKNIETSYSYLNSRKTKINI